MQFVRTLNPRTNRMDLTIESTNQPSVSFSIRMYSTLSNVKNNESEKILSSVNRFLGTLDQDTALLIHTMYQDLHGHLAARAKPTISEYQNDVTACLENGFAQTNLIVKLIAFCETDETLDEVYPDDDEVGKADHDTEENTFKVDDIIDLNAMGLISKLLIPIWGELDQTFDLLNYSIEEGNEALLKTVLPLYRHPELSEAYAKLETMVKRISDKSIKYYDRHNNSEELLYRANLTDDQFVFLCQFTVTAKLLVTYDPDSFTKTLPQYLGRALGEKIKDHLLKLHKVFIKM